MNERKSAVIVTVKQALLDWVRHHGIEPPYLPQEGCVWLIPTCSALSATIGFRAYIEAMKDRILDAELERFGVGLRAQILAAHTFEELIELAVRDDVELGPELDHS